jgi:hypothetical protein
MQRVMIFNIESFYGNNVLHKFLNGYIREYIRRNFEFP